MISKEHIDIIEGYRHSDTNEACSILNNIRSHYGGGWIEDCFCSIITRRAFIKTFNEWYEEYKLNKQ